MWPPAVFGSLTRNTIQKILNASCHERYGINRRFQTRGQNKPAINKTYQISPATSQMNMPLRFLDEITAMFFASKGSISFTLLRLVNSALIVTTSQASVIFMRGSPFRRTLHANITPGSSLLGVMWQPLVSFVKQQVDQRAGLALWQLLSLQCLPPDSKSRLVNSEILN